MQDVLAASCQPRRTGRTPRDARRASKARGFLHPPAYVAHSVAAAFASALMLHLLVELAGLMDPADPAGLLTVAGGMAAVLVTLAPFAVAFAVRAQRAWAGEPRTGDAEAG